ncbi:MAG: hypothetical protein NTX56_03950 [Proteobacteria bacterium]|nr:hypothetical protein [Pseudomonadota bacterium]
MNFAILVIFSLLWVDFMMPGFRICGPWHLQETSGLGASTCLAVGAGDTVSCRLNMINMRFGKIFVKLGKTFYSKKKRPKKAPIFNDLQIVHLLAVGLRRQNILDGGPIPLGWPPSPDAHGGGCLYSSSGNVPSLAGWVDAQLILAAHGDIRTAALARMLRMPSHLQRRNFHGIDGALLVLDPTHFAIFKTEVCVGYACAGGAALD